MATQEQIDAVGAILTAYNSDMRPDEDGHYDEEGALYTQALSQVLGLVEHFPTVEINGADVNLSTLDLTQAEDVAVLRAGLDQLRSDDRFLDILADYRDDGALSWSSAGKLRLAGVSQPMRENFGMLVALIDTPELLDAVPAVLTDAEEIEAAEIEISQENEIMDAINGSVFVIEQLLSSPELRQQLVDAGITGLADVENPDDAIFDAGSQAALQQLLGLMASEHVLNVEGMQDAGLIVYDQNIGSAFFGDRGLGNRNASGVVATMRDALNNNPDLVFRGPDGTEYRGVQALQHHLDFLSSVAEQQRDRDDLQLFVQQSNASSIVPAFSGPQAFMLRIAVQFLANFMPSLLPMIDGMARSYLGAGVFELADQFQPGLGGQIQGVIREVSPELLATLEGYDAMSPVDRARDQYMHAFGDIDDPAERQERLETLITQSEFLESLSPGERGPLVTQALRVAFAQAEAARAQGISAEDAADVFAERYTAIIEELNSEMGEPTPYEAIIANLPEEFVRLRGLTPENYEDILNEVRSNGTSVLVDPDGSVFVAMALPDGGLEAYDVTDELRAYIADPSTAQMPHLSRVSERIDSFDSPAQVANSVLGLPDVNVIRDSLEPASAVDPVAPEVQIVPGAGVTP